MRRSIGGIVVILIMIASVAAVVPMAAGVPPNGGDGDGTGTPGYWKNHPGAWPGQTIITVGVFSTQEYTKGEAIEIMKTSGKGDKTYDMFRALVAAQLNVLDGNDDSCINSYISQANLWMETYGPVGSGVNGSSDAWQEEWIYSSNGFTFLVPSGEDLYDMLDAYNNGELCAPPRD